MRLKAFKIFQQLSYPALIFFSSIVLMSLNWKDSIYEKQVYNNLNLVKYLNRQ